MLRLGPGDHFGETGVLTGGPSAVTIITLTPAMIYELAKEDLGSVLEANPEALRQLNRSVARWGAATTHGVEVKVADAAETGPVATWLAGQLQRWLSLATGRRYQPMHP